MSYGPGWGADPGHHRPRYLGRYPGVSELHELGRLGSVRLWASWEEVPEGVTGPLDAPCYEAAIQRSRVSHAEQGGRTEPDV